MSATSPPLDIGDLDLWDHQVRALETFAGFMKARGTSGGPSALIRMPTGTGKSGVIAVAAHRLLQGDALIVSPWDALVDQIGRDVRERFWNTIKVAPPSEKSTRRLYPTTVTQELASRTKPTIWTATTATLQRLHDDEPDAYAALSKSVRLVVVDEGHYEPALRWARAVRDMQRPTVLFTATPYRNDFKFFRIDEAHYFHYSHADAEKERFLRKVVFNTAQFGGSIEQFCDALIDSLTSDLPKHGESRAIVRCASKAHVLAVARELELRNQSVIAIHERFTTSDGDPLLRRRVPDPAKEAARIWVHQNKLTEGIDDPRFRLVAFFDPFRSERAFVQQVGRVLRNPGRKHNQRAIVLHDERSALEESWAAYVAYDRLHDPAELRRTPRDFATQQPAVQYITGRFRERFDLASPTVHLDFDYPRSARVYRVGGSFSIGEFETDVHEALADADFDTAPPIQADPSTRIHPYIAVRNSSLLFRKAFAEYAVGFTIYRRTSEYLFFYDSQGLAPPLDEEVPRVNAPDLQRLFDEHKSRLTTISLLNTDLGATSVRRRSLRARSIAELGPDLGDHAQFPSTIRGYNASNDSDRIDRYVGFTRSRVRDHVAGTTTFADYIKWIDHLADMLDDHGRRAPTVFQRFAEVIDRPDDPNPSNILLDFPHDAFQAIVNDQPVVLALDDVCVDVTNGEFRLSVNNVGHTVSVRWDDKAKRYHLESATLDDRYVAADGPDGLGDTLMAYLNREQAFRIIPAAKSAKDYCVYVGGTFIRPRLPLWGNSASGSFELLNILHAVTRLAKIGSEKGGPNSATAAGWSTDSIFGLIDQLGTGTEMATLMKGIDLLVCDDMNTEICDFLALDSTANRAIAIHAKGYSKPHPLSATALHEVTAQALKNLAPLQPYFAGRPANVDRWNEAWHSDGIGSVTSRVRRGGPLNGDDAWARFQRALRDPATSREVWLVLGKGTSRSRLDTERRKANPRPEIVQILFSLQSAWSAVSALGARLRVFCSP